VGDTYLAQDCTNVLPAVTTTGAVPQPCQTNVTLANFFPVALYESGGHPYEADFLSDGTIGTVQGLNMWIANAPVPADQNATTAYRVFYELNGNVYMGALWKDGTAFGYRQTDGSAVAYTIGLNQTAVASVQKGLITGATVAGSQAGSDAELGATVDLFGIGGHALNGALAPADLAAHYGLPAGLDGTGQTIAIVDGPGTGDAAADLNVYSQAFNLPLCNSAHPCFTQVTLGNGSAAASDDWGAEVALDTQMVHAIAPGATIILVTAASSASADLLSAINYAAALPGVTAVSLSAILRADPALTYQNEDILLASFQANQGLAIFASSGDEGNSWAGAGYPASSPYVTAVGGTRINAVSPALTQPGAASLEVAWQFSGGGPSIYAGMPAWQSGFLGAAAGSANGGMRATPDVAAVADFQHSAVAVYHEQHWIMAGGTSAAAPIWAGISALFGQYLANKGGSLAALVKAAPGGFNGLLYPPAVASGADPGLLDIVSGSNNLTDFACGVCVAGSGYDEVTGLGAPSVSALLQHY
jgi:subtilase family serine protease